MPVHQRRIEQENAEQEPVPSPLLGAPNLLWTDSLPSDQHNRGKARFLTTYTPPPTHVCFTYVNGLSTLFIPILMCKSAGESLSP